MSLLLDNIYLYFKISIFSLVYYFVGDNLKLSTLSEAHY